MAVVTPAADAGDECARSVCGGRRPLGKCEAGRFGCGRRFDRRAYGASSLGGGLAKCHSRSALRREICMAGDNNTGLGSMQFRTVDGLRIRFATNKKKDGDPILLLSPLPESILAFLPTWEIFSALGPVVAVDLPAFGLSESRADVRAPEPLGEFVVRIMEAFSLDQPHVVAPDVGTPACLFASANHPGIFKSLVIGSGATDHTDLGGILDEIVNAPSLEQFKDLTGEQFVRGAIGDMKNYKLPEYVLQDYLASYAGPRFFHAMAFV